MTKARLRGRRGGRIDASLLLLLLLLILVVTGGPLNCDTAFPSSELSRSMQLKTLVTRDSRKTSEGHARVREGTMAGWDLWVVWMGGRRSRVKSRAQGK